jgi:hypothetical protein
MNKENFLRFSRHVWGVKVLDYVRRRDYGLFFKKNFRTILNYENKHLNRISWFRSKIHHCLASLCKLLLSASRGKKDHDYAFFFSYLIITSKQTEDFFYVCAYASKKGVYRRHFICSFSALSPTSACISPTETCQAVSKTRTVLNHKYDKSIQ